MTMTPTELSWAAGLFEGEGNIRINKPTKQNLGTLMVSVTNCDPRIVEFFQERWPGYMKLQKKGRDREHVSDAWCWVIAAQKAADFLTALLNHFVTERTWTRAMLGLEFQGQKIRYDLVNRSEEYRVRQWDFYWAMRAWNYHPHRPQAEQHRKSRGPNAQDSGQSKPPG